MSTTSRSQKTDYRHQAPKGYNNIGHIIVPIKSQE